MEAKSSDKTAMGDASIASPDTTAEPEEGTWMGIHSGSGIAMHLCGPISHGSRRISMVSKRLARQLRW